MAVQGMTVAPNPLACEIATYTEEQLDRYLEENGRIVSVQDPENISPEFIQRLRDIVQRGATKARALDLDQVAARLQDVPDDREPFRRSLSLASTLPSPPQKEQELEYLREETESYHALVKAGGRPPYPFHLLEDFLWNPEQYLDHDQYRDIVHFWREPISNKAERTCFCSCHLSNWRCFRRLQRIIRDRSVIGEWTLINAATWNSWEAFVKRFGPKEGGWGFSEYTDNMKTRLTKYGFTRHFQLNRDLDRQDKLTTWVEYLGYEYYFYDRAASYVKRFQRRHDEAWEKLVSSNVLGLEETYEVICNIETAFRHASEEERAQQVVKSAAATVSSTEKAIGKSHGSREALRKRLLAEQSTLNAAKERHETIRVRNDAITAFLQKIRRYRCETGEADRYSCLLRWIEQQIPSIELELSSLNSAKDETNRRNTSRRLKRARSQEINEAQHSQERRHTERIRQSVSARRTPTVSPSPAREIRYCSIDDGRPLKRLKTSGRSGLADYSTSDTSVSSKLAPTSDTRTTKELEGANGSSSEPVRVSKPLRRSARIAEKRANSAMIAHVPTPPLSMVPEQSRVRSTARRAKKRRPKKDSPRPAAKPTRVAKKSRSSACPRGANKGGGTSALTCSHGLL